MAISRRRLLASAAAVGALSTSGRVFGPAIAQNKPLRIGVLAPRSGIAAAPGLNEIRATQWAVERYNAQGDIGGRKVELVIEDESSPKDTIERFSKPCSRRRSTACRASSPPAPKSRSDRWWRKHARSRSTGTARRRTAWTRKFSIRAICSARRTTSARRSCRRCSPSKSERQVRHRRRNQSGLFLWPQ